MKEEGLGNLVTFGLEGREHWPGGFSTDRKEGLLIKTNKIDPSLRETIKFIQNEDQIVKAFVQYEKYSDFWVQH